MNEMRALIWQDEFYTSVSYLKIGRRLINFSFVLENENQHVHIISDTLLNKYSF